MPSTTTLAINWKQLHALSEGNQEFEVELIKIFFVETKTQLQLLSLAIQERNLKTVEHLTHQIKGSSGNIGLLNLSQQASRLEQQARSGLLREDPDLLDAMIQELDLIQDFLEQASSSSSSYY